MLMLGTQSFRKSEDWEGLDKQIVELRGLHARLKISAAIGAVTRA
jgi:hypothetical protein